MPSSAILDVAIGIAFVYLFLSLICSVVNEGIATIFSLRAKNLVAGINSLFSQGKAANGELFVQEIYRHGLIRGLFKDPPDQAQPNVLAQAKNIFRVDLPSYIPSGTFAIALVDILAPSDGKSTRTLDQVREGLDTLKDGPTKNALVSLLADTKKDIPEFQQKVEQWFNDSMERAAGWYKRQAQRILLGIGLVLAVGLNVDTIKLAQSLWNNPVERQAAVDLAQKYVSDNKTPIQTGEDLQARADKLAVLGKQLPFPFGWQAAPRYSLYEWLAAVAGWFITMLALSLGAPFWFDTLSKFMSVRSTLKPKTDQKDA